MSRRAAWPPIVDEALVERMIPAVQRAIVEATVSDDRDGNALAGVVTLVAPDVANALLMVLASILESAPDCATPMGIRLTGEAAGRELSELVREVRRLKLAEEAGTGTVQ